MKGRKEKIFSTDSPQILFKRIHPRGIGMDRRELMPVYASGKCINRSTATYFAESDAGVQPVHKIVNVDSQLRIQRVQPLGQILFHRDQILLRGLERPVRPRFQKHRHAASTIPETSIDRHFSTSTHMFTKYFHICANYSLLLSYLFWRNLFINVNKDYFIDLFSRHRSKERNWFRDTFETAKILLHRHKCNTNLPYPFNGVYSYDVEKNIYMHDDRCKLRVATSGKYIYYKRKENLSFVSVE